MVSSTYKTGKDLKVALDRGCIKDCHHCGLRTSNNNCLLQVKEQWQQWADEQHKKFGNSLNET